MAIIDFIRNKHIYDEMGYRIDIEDDGYRRHYICRERINDVLIFKKMRKTNSLFQMSFIRAPHHSQNIIEVPFSAFKQ